ncbi:MAG: nucleotidyltransferase domain-containing protein [Actinomycetota bacterium]|nr:nucleotidyltransferase domain-containing protein [Actinomycetota bacterium]
MTSLLDIGSQLIAARRMNAISQRELGVRLGVRQQQVARWEATGYRTASLAHVAAAAVALGCTPGAVAVTTPLANTPLAAEAPAAYAVDSSSAVTPVRDLGEIAARVRAHGDALRDRYTITRVGVFGSFASGEQTSLSDVDIVVDIEDPGGFRFIEAADFTEEILGRRVDIARPHLLKDRLRDRVLEEVIYVWSA